MKDDQIFSWVNAIIWDCHWFTFLRRGFAEKGYDMGNAISTSF
ncbi:hypothetical protein GCM10025794_29290 [Massilia kyonggiensis]